MPENGSTKKRAGESEATAMDSEDCEEEDDDEKMMQAAEVDVDFDEESADGEDEDKDKEDVEDEEMEDAGAADPIGTPSPAKKQGIRLRSGRFKRRRSKETSGLTPPEEHNTAKRARLTTERKSKRKSAKSLNGDDASVAADESSASVKLPAPPIAPKASTTITTTTTLRTATRGGRESLLATDPVAVAVAQDPESTVEESETSHLPPASVEDSNRRLFESQSNKSTAAAPISEESTFRRTELTLTTKKTHLEPEAPTANESSSCMNGDHGEMDTGTTYLKTDSRKALLWRIILFVLLFYPLFVVFWPLTVALAERIVPLQELTLPDSISEEVQSGIKVDESTETGKGPSDVLQSIETLWRLRERAGKKKESVQHSRQVLGELSSTVSLLIEEKKTALERSARLHEAERLLLTALDANTHLHAPVWRELRESLKGLGQSVLDVMTVDLWQVDAPESCAHVARAGDSSSIVGSEDSNPPVLPSEVKEKLDGLNETTMQSATALMGSPEGEEAVTDWIKNHIGKILQGNEQATGIITELANGSFKETHITAASDEYGEGGLNLDEIYEVLEYRLEIERADRTGEYDHASIYNGAKILRDGRRGTSPSLVDNLPLGNRLLQLSRLRFYGYGPEEAITPTYPTSALGQCWSFQQAPVADLLKRRRSQGGRSGDDYKRGNFGTLTISLPTPVAVRNVVIEHPAKALTDQSNSAIRAFRIIGYEDGEAATKSWSLGSFEYSIESSSLQEFQVSSEIFGNPIPPLSSISLAIDSNWGNDYACLYRFRVHGDETKAEDDDDPFER